MGDTVSREHRRIVQVSFLAIGLIGMLSSCFQLPKPPDERAFSEPTSFTVGSWPRSANVGDFNEDGHLDLAVGHSGDYISILIGNGEGSFQPLSPLLVDEDPFIGNPWSLQVGDFNHDGHLDLAAANALVDQTLGGGVSILLGNGEEHFHLVNQIPVTERPPDLSPSSLAVGDFNRDGIEDLVTANGVQALEIGRGEDTISIFLGLGGGSFGRPMKFPVGNGARFVTMGKFNNDGYPDLAVINLGQITILFGKGGAEFHLANRFPVAEYRQFGNPLSLAVGDLNQDGHQDLAVTLPRGGAVAIIVVDGMGNFGLASILAGGNDPYRVVIGDFNGDDHQDLAVTNPRGDMVSILWSDVKGDFSLADHFPAGDAPEEIAVGDFDEDGDLDIAVTNGRAGTVSILLNRLRERERG